MITERMVPELIPVLCSRHAGDVSHKPGVGCYYLPSGLQLPWQPLRGLLPVSSLPKTVIQQRRGCDLNRGSSAPKSSTLTTRLPCHSCVCLRYNLIICDRRTDERTRGSVCGVYEETRSTTRQRSRINTHYRPTHGVLIVQPALERRDSN